MQIFCLFFLFYGSERTNLLSKNLKESSEKVGGIFGDFLKGFLIFLTGRHKNIVIFGITTPSEG
jgi:hypothetical protein